MLEQLVEKWGDIPPYLKEEHGTFNVSFTIWLLPFKVSSLEGNTLGVIVPDANFLSYLKRKHTPLLKVSIEEATGITCDVNLILEGDMKARQSKQLIQTKQEYVSPTVLQNANLNPRYTLDTFVVGTNDNPAYAASSAVAEPPGEICNSLFIYGGMGLGKTHLMYSIVHFMLKNNPVVKTLYATSEKSTNELIGAIRSKNNIFTTEFWKRYRNNDVLLIDDIQFIIGKESTQEESFHISNVLHEAKKQIITSSGKPPKEIETLEERLRSRFGWGLTMDIQSPNYETRMVIPRKEEELEGYNIDNGVTEYIATNIKSSTRELEGALTKIVALSKLDNNKEISIVLAEEALKDIISSGSEKGVTPELIIQVVADHFGITLLDISSQKRNREVVLPRQIVMYLYQSMTDASLQVIGKYLGGRDHTTIIHGREKIIVELEANESLSNTIDILKKKTSSQQRTASDISTAEDYVDKVLVLCG